MKIKYDGEIQTERTNMSQKLGTGLGKKKLFPKKLNYNAILI